jgi:hypothetical protein
MAFSPGGAYAEETKKERHRKFTLGVGPAVVKFDTKIKFGDKETGRSFLIDPEGDLGLPESNTVGTIYGLYHFRKKHYLGFAFFRIKRESTLFDDEFIADDLVVRGKASLFDRTRFYQLYYGHALFEDERSRVLFTAGLYGLELRYTFEAEGEITLGGITHTGTFKEETSVFAPLPLFGLDFFFSFTPSWGIGTKVSLVGGSFQDVSALVSQTSVNARYQFSKRVGGIFGITYFDADVKIEDDTDRTDVDYGYNGVFLGIHAIF